MKNEMIRIWVNRVLAFLAGGLLIFIIMQATIINSAADKNNKLKNQLDDIQFAPGRLLDNAKGYFGQNDYDSAKKTLNTLFEKHPVSKEAVEGKALFTVIETKQAEQDKKWNDAVVGIRKDWEKTMVVQLKEQFEKDRAQMEKDLNDNLDREWDRVKDNLRKEWEKG